MQSDIIDFLKKLETEITAAGQLNNRLQQEITTFESILQTLDTTKKPDEKDNNLESIALYLQQVKLAAQKLKHTHLTLLNNNTVPQEAEMNKQIIILLKKLNSL